MGRFLCDADVSVMLAGRGVVPGAGAERTKAGRACAHEAGGQSGKKGDFW